VSVASLEQVAREAGGRLWFQLNLWRDRASSYDLVARAEANGYEALMLTVDNPASPNREYNARNGLHALPLRFGSRFPSIAWRSCSRTPRASPTTPMSTRSDAPISSGSMSILTKVAVGENRGRRP